MTANITDLGLVARMIFVIGLTVVGITGNVVILVIYTPNRNQPGRLFIIILAIIDLYGVPGVLATTIPWEQGKLNPMLVWSMVTLMQMSYMFVTVAMALDRVLAVFTPYKYKVYRRQMVKIVALVFGVTVICLVLSFNVLLVAYPEFVLLNAYLHMLCYGIGLLIIMLAYPAIAVRLYWQRKKVRAAHPAPQHLVLQVAHNSNTLSATGKQMKTLRLYLVILALFLLSFIGTGFVIGGIKVFAYVSQINNVANFFIYYWMMDSFRKKVKGLMGNIGTVCLKSSTI